PIATIRKQNAVLDQIVQGCLIGTEDYRKLIAFYTSDDGLDAAPLIERDLSMVVSRSINRSIFKSAVKLNAKIEKVLFKRFKEKKPEYYDELQSVEYLVENDVSAGENFILGEPETYSRFIGLIKKYRHPMIREFLAACKGIAGMKPDRLYAAIEIMRFMHLAYSKNQAVPTPAGVTMTLGKAFEEGGNCSTRAPTLQLGLQEAGIRSRYCRGFLRGSSRRHAWVEADVFDDGTYALILDPNKTNIYVKGNIAAPGMYLYADEKRVEKDYHNKIWRPKIIH
ncbi:transglutaminase-like domain-containing protein, partial [Candidatus Woesearchaeota archaeon]|nr:transglutaminase-like domain-containing protein [Candidatus Woesearchaeota archaeon]